MFTQTKTTKVAIIDDHVLVRHALKYMVESFGDSRVVFQCSHGKEYVDSCRNIEKPDVIFLDISMPVMNGLETAQWLSVHYPEIPVVMLTAHDSEITQIRSIQFGSRGFIRKDSDPAELKTAIYTATRTDFFHAGATAMRFLTILRNPNGGHVQLQKHLLTDQEITFMKLSCTELTYKAIAKIMGITPRAVDTIRDHLFMKLDVRSRVGLVMVAIRSGIVNLFDLDNLKGL